MKAQRIHTPVFLLLMSISITQAQNSASSFNKSQSNNYQIEDQTYSRPQSKFSSGNYNTYLYLGEECNMCLYEDWKKGTLIMKDETVINDRLLRYNIYNQQMEFVFDNDTSALANPDDFESIVFGGHTFIYGSFLCNQSIHRGYLEILVNGEVSLYLQRYIKYKLIYKNEDINSLEEDHKYYREDILYYTDHQSPAKPLPLKKKEILKLLNNPEKDIKLFMKETKNKLSTKEDLIHLFEYYYSNSPT